MELWVLAVKLSDKPLYLTPENGYDEHIEKALKFYSASEADAFKDEIKPVFTVHPISNNFDY